MTESVDDRGLWRQQLSELRNRLSRPIADRDGLLTLLLAPLQLLDLVPDRLAEKERIHADWSRLDLGRAVSTGILRGTDWIGEVQEVLLKVVFPDWYDVLQDGGLLDPILQQWFAPEGEDSLIVGQVLLNSLATVSKLLSEAARDAPARRGRVLPLLEKTTSLFLQRGSLFKMAMACRSGQDASVRGMLRWQDGCRQLLSLPNRVANAFGTAVPGQLDVRHINGWTLTQLEELISLDGDAKLTSTLLERLLRLGVLSDIQEWHRQPSGGWADMLRAMARHVTPPGFPSDYTRTWRRTIGRLPSDDQVSLLMSLIRALDSNCLRKRQIATLLNGTEAVRLGAEGRTFSSQQTWNSSLVLAQICSIFADDRGEDDEDAYEQQQSFLTLVLEHPSYTTMSPAMIRVLIHVLLGFDSTFMISSATLLSLVKRWSDATKLSSLEEDIASATAIGLLIISSPQGSKAVSSLSTSPDFINGVSQHLKHLSPTVRRLGMLLAELVSEKVGKSLSFGKGVWDGRGDGREEVRVLRAAILAFPQRTLSLVLTETAVLDALDLSQSIDIASLTLNKLPPEEKASRTRNTRALPKKVAPRRKSPELLDGDGDSVQLPSLTNIGGTKPHRSLITAISDEEQTSSSAESDSSDEEIAGKQDAGVETTEEGKAFGMGVPGSKSKTRPPIYVNELAPLLRKNERDGVRMALRYGRALIQRKAGWGGEVDESAIEVCMALCALQDNFRIAEFEQRRLGMLTELTVASHTHVAPCLVEQYFVHQYSMAQRIAILNALAFAAAQLATGKEVEQVSRARQTNVSSMAGEISVDAIQRAKSEGDRRMPEIKREKGFLIHVPNTSRKDPGSILSTRVEASNRYTGVALTSFIFPMVGRMRNHVQRNGAAGMRSGRGIIDMPFMVGASLDTLSVLCHYAQSEPQFRNQVVPEVIDLVLVITRPHLADSAKGVEDEAEGGDDGGGSSTILSAACSLAVTLLDACWHLDFGASLTRQHAAHLLVELQHWASALFEVAEGGTGGPIGRLGRSSAALLLRLNEIQEHHSDRLGRIAY